jgi:predicted HTH domain antitoxin
MNITIPDELLEQNQLSSQMIKQEISLFLLEKFHLTREQATQIAEVPLFEFNQLIEKYKTEPLKKLNKLNNLKNRQCVIGDSEDLVHNDWSKEWNTPSI